MKNSHREAGLGCTQEKEYGFKEGEASIKLYYWHFPDKNKSVNALCRAALKEELTRKKMPKYKNNLLFLTRNLNLQ